MSESTETATEETTEVAEQQTEGAPTEENPGGETDESTEHKPGEEQEPKGTPEEDLPDWARKELTKVRGEAANYRVKLREAETALKDAKSVEEFEAARADLSNKIAELESALLRERVARKFELPDELASRLQGADEAALEADAKALQKFVTPAAPESLSGGLDPDEGDDGFDPVKAVQAARRSRY